MDWFGYVGGFGYWNFKLFFERHDSLLQELLTPEPCQTHQGESEKNENDPRNI